MGYAPGPPGTTRPHRYPPVRWGFAIPRPAVGGRRYDPRHHPRPWGDHAHHATTLLLTAALLCAGAAVGCSKSGDETAKDCAAALTERTGGEPGYKPTVAEAEEQVDALDDTLADMVRSGHQGAARDAFDTAEKKTKEGGKGRPEACEPLSEDDYTALLTAKALDGLGWTDEDGRFDKLKMAEGLRE